MFSRKKRNKPKSKIISEEEELVKKANEQENPFEQLTSFHSFTRNGLQVHLKFFKIKDLQKDIANWCFDLLKRNMKQMYEESAWGWDEKEKVLEMTEEPALYLIAFTQEEKPIAFSHFRFDVDYGQPVLYCYELQLELQYRQKGLGRFMLQILELIAFRAGLKKVVLTVFLHNPKAVCFFKSLGYAVDETSPVNTLMEQFDYEILSKSKKKNQS
nr:EOG090X0MNC [Megafenestra aurita]